MIPEAEHDRPVIVVVPVIMPAPMWPMAVAVPAVRVITRAIVVLQAMDPSACRIEFSTQGATLRPVQVTVTCEASFKLGDVPLLATQPFCLFAGQFAAVDALFDPRVLAIDALLNQAPVVVMAKATVRNGWH